MERSDWTIELPQTSAAWEGGHIDGLGDIGIGELEVQADDLAVAACEYSGGWPDCVEVYIDSVTPNAEELELKVKLYFSETIPSSCKDMPYVKDRELRLVLNLPRGSTSALVEVSTADRDNWDIEDRNSAYDGA